ncbi:glycosyltransferase family 2 protein [Marinobacter daepoensis]|uniref:Glycosyltransferase family 2 protein n=1 Tax=Marinobacter daepoensis TaxID=262077 RepID=A0ABS3BDU9_9GAMM|nr:glycosyltransferase family 2 protein [Marinobacter daepoensis]MBN7768882.1 glycosyltransferase family 2 protein [Marinobacter daepoensis]MBY6077572.1 glycosyltransferase family 2 protein [Marinobacter daepoensis]
MEFPLVTVIVPAYNAEKYIAETLTSICNQTYAPLEIIVVDDGSTDRTAEIIKTDFPNVRYVHQVNSGSCAAPRNNGLSLASGAYVTFLDADDIMTPDKIKTQVMELEANPYAVMTISNYRNFSIDKHEPDHFSTCPRISGELKKANTAYLTLTPEGCRAIMIDENFTSACSPLYRRKHLIDEKGYDISLRACEDFHLNYRIAMRGTVIVNPIIGFERRMHESNMSSDNERMLRYFIASRKDLARMESNPALAKALYHRISDVNRSLQSCLLIKNQRKEALRIFKETFPPASFRNLKADLKLALKIAVKKSRNRTKPEL